MKISYNRLRSYISIGEGIDVICEVLVSLGFEVEGIDKIGFSGSGPIVFGKVISRDCHPNADRLSVCRVDIGDDELQIVCGATNFGAGDSVAVALTGAMVGGIALKKTKMRGIESEGMMCSAAELGLANDSEGLLLLNEFEAKLGSPVADLFDEADYIIDLSITPNRGDCLSYLGIARELSAYFERSINSIDTAELRKGANSGLLVEVDDCDCLRYCGLKVSNVVVGASPDWLREQLELIGMRSKNIIVDLTNFVMLEIGQPLHAFDANSIVGDKVIVRKAKNDEILECLDGKSCKLFDSVTIIADAKKPIAIAGIMGGKNSEISESTSAIFLESANFSSESIKKSTKLLELSSESAYRFERTVDLALADYAIERFVALLRKMQPDIVVEEYVEVGSAKQNFLEIDCDFSKIKKLLGFDVDIDIFESILRRLNFEISSSGNYLKVVVPSYRRHDVTTEAGLVEEFLRVYGTSKIVPSLPNSRPTDVSDDLLINVKRQHGEILSTLGFYECYTDSLQPANIYEDGIIEEDHILKLSVTNPLNKDHEVLRSSLIPALIEVFKTNKNNGNSMSRVFESGRIFKIIDGELCELFATTFLLKDVDNEFVKSVEPASIDAVKSVIESLLPSLGLPKNIIQLSQKTANTLWQENFCGSFGSLHRSGILCEFGYINTSFSKKWLKDNVLLGCEITLIPEKLKKPAIKQFEEFSDLPVVRKDLSILVNNDTLAEEIRKKVELAARKSVSANVKLNDVRIFDVYYSKNSDEKSISLAITFGSNSITLTDAEISPVFANVQKILERDNLKIRKQTI